LRCILRHYGVPISTPHSSGFARLASEAFYFAIPILSFYDFIKFITVKDSLLPKQGYSIFIRSDLCVQEKGCWAYSPDLHVVFLAKVHYE